MKTLKENKAKENKEMRIFFEIMESIIMTYRKS